MSAHESRSILQTNTTLCQSLILYSSDFQQGVSGMFHLGDSEPSYMGDGSPAHLHPWN